MPASAHADGPAQVRRIKVISMGDGGVGKSCLIKRYCEGKFVPRYITTIGIDFGVKPVQVGGVPTRVNFWDLAGGNEYYDIRNEFYRDAQGAVLVYDVHERATFDSLARWMEESARHGVRDLVLAVCANKADGQGRAVGEEEGRRWAAEHGAAFFAEVSAKEGTGVMSLFERLFAAVAERFYGKENG